MSTSSPSSRINKNDIVATPLENEGVILNLKTKYYYSVNDTGLRIWELLEEGKSDAEIIAILCDEYDVDANTCETDVTGILQSMRKEKLIA